MFSAGAGLLCTGNCESRCSISEHEADAYDIYFTVSELSAYRVSFITVRQCRVCLACAQLSDYAIQKE